jgi:hypothetical protein
MKALAIVPDFDVVEDHQPDLGAGDQGRRVHVRFSGCRSALYGGVVTAVAHPAHADLVVVDGQQVLDQGTWCTDEV